MVEKRLDIYSIIAEVVIFEVLKLASYSLARHSKLEHRVEEHIELLDEHILQLDEHIVKLDRHLNIHNS